MERSTFLCASLSPPACDDKERTLKAQFISLRFYQHGHRNVSLKSKTRDADLAASSWLHCWPVSDTVCSHPYSVSFTAGRGEMWVASRL